MYTQISTSHQAVPVRCDYVGLGFDRPQKENETLKKENAALKKENETLKKKLQKKKK